MSKQRVLPADIYDALELSAWVHGGIGAGRWWDAGDDNPLCATGHRWFLEPPADGHEIADAFGHAGIHSGINDPAVHAINERSGNAPNARVPFKKWCKELNVVRGA